MEDRLADEPRCFPKIIRQMGEPHQRCNGRFGKLSHLFARLFFARRIKADFKFAHSGVARRQIVPAVNDRGKPQRITLPFNENG